MQQNEKIRYDKLAYKYDDPKNARWNYRKQRQLEVIKEYICLKPNDRILDIGCGTGYYTFPLAVTEDITIYGIDMSENMIKVANSKNQNSNVTFIIGDMYHLPFKDNCFDVIVSMGTISNNFSAWKEVERVVKDDYQIIINVKNALSCNYLIVYGYRYFTRLFKLNWPWMIYAQFKRHFRIEKMKCVNFIPPVIPYFLLPFCKFLDKTIEHIPILNWTGQYIILKIKKKGGNK